MSSQKIDPKEVEEAQAHAKELLELFRAWVPKRKATVREIREVAKELDQVSKNVNVAKLTGTTAAVAGGIATVAGIGVTFMTGGLAAPLIGWGIAGSVAGAVTNSGAEVVGHYISKEKMDKAQKILNEEAKLTEEIEQKKAALDKMVDRLSWSLNLDRDQVLGILFLTNVVGTFWQNLRFGRGLGGSPTSMLLLYTAVSGMALVFTRVSFETVGKGMTKTAINISLKGVTKVVGSVLKGLAVGAAGFVLVWDIYQLVETSVNMFEGSKSAGADALRKVAAELEKQTKEMEEFLEGLQEQAEDYQEQINEQFHKLLRKISRAECATEEQKETVWQYIQHYAEEDWKTAFLSGLDYDNYTFHLARVLHILYKLVKDYQENEDEDDRDHIKITIIAHGNIDINLNIASLFYYLNPVLETVTLYEPWGCTIEAQGVYGITTNSISISNVSYSGEVRPGRPTDWNVLPRDFTQIPTTLLTPVKIGEPAHEHLVGIFALLQAKADGLVIPYFTGLGYDLLPFPTVPLWVLCNALALIGIFRKATVSIRVAACLSVQDPSRVSGHVPCSQYCTVDASANPPVMMTNNIGLPYELVRQLRPLDRIL